VPLQNENIDDMLHRHFQSVSALRLDLCHVAGGDGDDYHVLLRRTCLSCVGGFDGFISNMDSNLRSGFH
jgi:hypothetical protein